MNLLPVIDQDILANLKSKNRQTDRQKDLKQEEIGSGKHKN